MRNVYRLILSFGIIAFTLLSPQIVKTEQRSVKNHPITDNILRSKIAFAVVGEEITRGLNLHTLSESDSWKLRGPVLLEPQTDIHFQLREQYGRIVNTVYFRAASDAGSPSQNSPISPKNRPVLYQKAAEIIRDFIAERNISVIVVSYAPIGISEMAAIRRLQGEVRYTYEIINSASVSVPLKNIAALIKLPFITEIWPNRKGHLQQLPQKPPVKQIGADKVHEQPPNGLGVTGKGVIVGVVDNGMTWDSNSPIDHWIDRSRVNGIRPTVDVIRTTTSDRDHGIVVARVIGAALHNNKIGVAPEVRFVDARRGLTILDSDYDDVMAALNWAADRDTDIINISKNWMPWQYGRHGNDRMSKLIDTLVDDRGIIVVNAAGNFAMQRVTKNFHPTSSPSNFEHEFNSNETTRVRVTLAWDPGSDRYDLDLVLLDSNGNELSASRNHDDDGIDIFSHNEPWGNAKWKKPEYSGFVYEQLGYDVSIDTPYKVKVEGYNASGGKKYEVWLETENNDQSPPTFDQPTKAQTVGVPGYSKKVITVGAVRPDNSITEYSSRGPSDTLLIKPEVVAPGKVYLTDGTTTYGPKGFAQGTSFAAPHVSGVAALILDAVGKNSAGEWNFSPNEVKSAIVRGAEVVGNPSNTPDNEFGAGLVKADNIIFGGTVNPGQQMYFKITPRLDSYSYNNLFLDADTDLAIAISWENNSSNLDLELLDKNIRSPFQSVTGIKSQKVVSPFLSSWFYLKVIHNDPKGQPIRFTGASTHPIEDITQVTELDLHSNNITDISALAGLTQLKELNLSFNINITDISALAGLTQLTKLNLRGNKITDVAALAGLTQLKEINLRDNKITDVAALAGLTQLKELDLRGNKNITDIAALAGLTQLKELNLRDNNITDVSTLAGLTQLTKLNLRGNKNITDISTLAGLTQLKELDLSLNNITDIAALAGLTQLTKLNLDINRISDISSLVGLASLKHLDIRTNPLSYDSVNTHIPAMLANGVQVIYDNRTHPTLLKISGDMQEGEIDTALTTPFVVEVVDASGKPMKNVSVTFAITAGKGSLSTTNTTTDAKGRASTFLTFGSDTGTTTIRVTAENISQPVEFTATAKPSSSDSPVTIPDANLREEIVKTLGKPSGGTLTIKDMSTLTTLKAYNANIHDLTGLQHAHNLKTLRLEGDFTDVVPLAALIQLTNLHLSGDIIDVRPLENLTQLTTLHLWNNNITDVAPLAKLTKLTELWLPGNNITDVSPLAKLTKLTSLYLNHNNIIDVSPLENLTQLTSLYLRGNFHWNNRFTDVSPLKNLTQLRILDIADNHITDVSPLENLIQLTRLDLRGNTFWGNSLTDVSPLAKLTKLTELNLSRNYITDVSSLKNLTKLTRLRLWGNNITDIRPLKNLIQLTYLLLDGNEITDVAPLKNLIQLTYLDLGDNNITDVAPLENLTKLTQLYLYNNTIADISPLVGLNLTGTQWDSTGLSLEGNPLSYAAIHTHIPAMQAKGIVVKFDDRAHPALLKVSGDAQVDAPGTALPTPFVVEAMDASGKPIANVSVTFTITAGGGKLSTTTTTTDAKGRASTFLTFGSTTGETTIHVTAENISQPVEFTATASSRGTPVTIPDANLRAKIVETLGKSSDAMLTTEDMLTLTTLNARKANIHVLTGLQHAHNLKTLRLGSNNIVDLSPLAELTQLTSLNLAFNVSPVSVNGLTDVTPLENLTKLRTLNLGGNYITDVTPLEKLPKLTNLEMWGNRITDVAHLAKLTQLTHLDLSSNAITDVSPLENLTKLINLDLSTNRKLDVSSLEKLTQLRILDLGGNNITDVAPLASSLEKLTQLTTLYLGDNNITDLSPLEKLIQLTGLMLWRNNITDVAPLENLTKLTSLYLTSNNITDVTPLENLVGLTTLYLSSNSIADVTPLENLTQLTRLDLNNNTIADISPLVGLNLIGTRWDSTGLSLKGNPLSYAAIHTQIPAMQAKGIVVEFDDRAHPALLKVSGDAQVGAPGAVLPTPFVVEAMDASGKPIANVSVTFTITAGEGQLSATTRTTDTNGKAETVLTLGPSLGKQTVTATATEIMPSVLTFTAIATEEPERFAADVNGDGEVNIQDVVLVSSNLGQTGKNAADVNGDGEVNIQDLVAVTAALGEVAAAPAVLRQQGAAHLTQEEVQHWLTQAQQANLTDVTSLRGIRYLEQLLSALTPKETALLANYPNPFNPETWIPYQLATPADVTLKIYDIQGRIVRDLDLGHQRAGMYHGRSRAAYWDGRNAVGEHVASGVYFYTLTTGDFTATRKLLIRK